MKRSAGCLLLGLLILLVALVVFSKLPVEQGNPSTEAVPTALLTALFTAVPTPSISCTPPADNVLCTHGYISHCPCYRMQMETYQAEQRTATSTP